MSSYPHWLTVMEESDLYILAECFGEVDIRMADELARFGLVIIGMSGGIDVRLSIMKVGGLAVMLKAAGHDA